MRRRRDPLESLVVTRKAHGWFVWRDIVTLLLAVAVVMLVRQVGDLRDQLDAASSARTRQIQALTDQQAQLQAQLSAKDARIRQLTDALTKAGVPVPVIVRVIPAPTPKPTLAPTPSPSKPAPSPAPRPTATRTPSPSPTPTGPCVLGILFC